MIERYDSMELYDIILKAEDPGKFVSVYMDRLIYERNFHQKRMIGLLMTMSLGDIDQCQDEIAEIERKLEKINMCIKLCQSEKRNK